MNKRFLTVAFLFSISTAALAQPLSSALPAAAQNGSSGVNLRHTVVVDVVQKTKNAVVNISAKVILQRRLNVNSFFQDLGPIINVPGKSLGSGFIIHPDGYVVTNNHVIDRATQITVELVDGRKLPAELVGTDPEADLAILRVHSNKLLPSIELGDSEDLMIGEPAIAVGNPFGFSHSVSTGIVSALHRNLKDVENRESLTDLIQTDAAINPGNSGGPLLNAYGQVIGINTAIRGDAQNIGFAIPINDLRKLIPVLMSPSLEKLDVPLKLTEKLSITPPANVTAKVLDGNAIVESIDGVKIHNIVDAYAQLLRCRAGDKVSLVTSQGTKTVVAETAPAPSPAAQARNRLGISVAAISPELAMQMRLPPNCGVIISSVDTQSPAAIAGVQAGDVVFQLGITRIRSLEDFDMALQRLPDFGRVRIGVIRDNRIGYALLRL